MAPDDLGSSERVPDPSAHQFGAFALEERIYQQRPVIAGQTPMRIQ